MYCTSDAYCSKLLSSILQSALGYSVLATWESSVLYPLLCPHLGTRGVLLYLTWYPTCLQKQAHTPNAPPEMDSSIWFFWFSYISLEEGRDTRSGSIYHLIQLFTLSHYVSQVLHFTRTSRAADRTSRSTDLLFAVHTNSAGIASSSSYWAPLRLTRACVPEQIPTFCRATSSIVAFHQP